MDVLTIEQVLQDRKMRIETFLNVMTKDNELVPFRLNRIQDLELSSQSELRRDLFLKPAQVGSTTFWVGDFLLDTMLNPARTSIIVAYDETIASRLLLKAKQLYRDIVREESGHYFPWPELGRDSTNEMFFPDLGSTLFIGSAGSYNFGRGEPIHNVLFSEVAFYKNAAKTIGPAQDRVSMKTGTIVLESTPNGEEGEGAFFCETYRQGRNNPDAFYQSHFFPWWFHDEYSLERGSIYALASDRYELEYSEEELNLINLHTLTEDQIRWRRKKMSEKQLLYQQGEDRALFGQEFPEDDETCFISTGDQAYDSVLIEKLYRSCFIPTDSYDGAMVWFPPEPGHYYDVTCDPSLGTGRMGNSKTVLHVWEFWEDDDGKEYGRHCARVSGNFNAEMASAKALSLAEHYNKARIVVETNPPGIPIAYMLQNYPYLYMREDIISGRPTKQIGWLTTPRTKPQMTQQLAFMLPRIITYDAEFVAQLRNMRYVDGRVVARGPDDHHDAGAIAMVCRRSRRSSSSGFIGTTKGWKD